MTPSQRRYWRLPQRRIRQDHGSRRHRVRRAAGRAWPVRTNIAGSATAPMVSQPLPAHWAEVTQQTPPFTAASPPVSSQG